jgi:drug/metabolite transporter (DMT)-like permease
MYDGVLLKEGAMPRVTRTGAIFAVVSAVCFGFSGSAAKALIDAGLTPLQAVWIRLTGAAIALVVITAVINPRALRVPRTRIRFLLAYSLVGCAGVQAFYYGTVARLPVGMAVLLEYLSPVLVVAWVRLVRRVRLPSPAFVGAGLAILGIACVVQVWHAAGIDGPGLLLGIVTAACAAVYFLLSQDAADGIHPLAPLTWGLTGAALILVPLAGPWHLPWHVLAGDLAVGASTMPAWLVAGWLILIGTIVAYATSIAALRRLTAAVGATVASLEVITSVVIAWALLGETLGTAQLIGGGLVLVGALLAQRVVIQPAARMPAHPEMADGGKSLGRDPAAMSARD